MMNRAVISIICCLGISAFATADVPRLIHYQGKLVTSGGAVVAGPVDLRVRLYGDPVNPSPMMYDETHTAVALNRGLFSVLIGSLAGGVPDTAFAGDAAYLGVAVNGAAELSPRIRIATAPYAGKTRAAEQLVAPGTVAPVVTAATGGRVGIGTASPDSSALADFSSTTGGLLPPRMTTAQRDAIGSPAEGLMVFNSDTGCLNMRMGSIWRVFGAPETPGAITGPTDVCSGSTGVAYSVGDVPGAVSFQWEVPPGSTVTSGQGTAFPTVDFGPLTGSVSVKAVNGCGTSAANTLSVVVSGSPPATPTEIAGPLLPIEGSDIEYSTPAVFGATSFTWTIPSGWTLVSGQGNNSITVTIGAAGGDITVTANNACGSSSPRTKSIPSVIAVTNLATSPTTLGYLGALQAVRVPAGVTSMTIEVWGAEGGPGGAGLGGKGARMRGTFAVAPDELLKVLVGQKPPSQAGGGGGTFVTRADDSPMIIAGGGGGSGDSAGPNMDGTTSQNGQAGGSSGGGGYPAGGAGGIDGNGGGGGHAGSGGGGLLTDGVTGNYGGGGKSFLNGGAGGTAGSGEAFGGFGGGGGGYVTSYGGGGGGYSGGGGGGYPPPIGGGGGGSFNDGSSQDNASGVRTGDGQVTFSW